MCTNYGSVLSPTGHMSPKCPEKDKIQKEAWAICKAEQHIQAEQKKDNDESWQSDKSS